LVSRAADAAAVRPAGETLASEGVGQVELERGVTAVELFFDLVFVFAVTQLTNFLAQGPSWTHLLQAIAILMTLWFAWTAYAWLGNTAPADVGPVKVVLLLATAPMLVVALAVPHAFGRDVLAFGIGFFIVRAIHIVGYAVLSRDEPTLRRVVFRLARSIMPAAALLLLAGAVHGHTRTALWVAALAIDYGGMFLGGTEGWNVDAKHFAERHRLIIIIALGEALVAVGLGANTLGLRAGVIACALLGVGTTVLLWWVYFDRTALVAERTLATTEGDARARLARDSFSYLHLPMVAGIVPFAFGVKLTILHVNADLRSVPAYGLFVGVAIYLLALSWFRRRTVGSFNRQRLGAAVILCALAPVAICLPALLSLGLVTSVVVGLVSLDAIRFRGVEKSVRSPALKPLSG
jgi:low temperature requirement protein LtrA